MRRREHHLLLLVLAAALLLVCWPSRLVRGEPAPPAAGNRFLSSLPAGFHMPRDTVGQRVLREYGAMFIARGVSLPTVVAFPDEAAVTAFQAAVPITGDKVGDVDIELQTPAMAALRKALAEITAAGHTLTPRNTAAARRDYAETVKNWASRIDPGLVHWVAKGKLTKVQAARIRALSPADQVPEILKLEARGLYFSPRFDKTVIHSVAPPGASQHIALLALDIREHDNPKVRQILATHGWFQTIPSDHPHFTYLGVTANHLPALGLKQVVSGGRSYWVPDF